MPYDTISAIPRQRESGHFTGEEVVEATFWRNPEDSRRHFIGGSDARIIMGEDEAALIRLWREKRGEIEPEDLSGNLVVRLGLATEELNRRWYEANTSQMITDIQQKVRHPVLRWMGATLDGRVQGSDAVFEAKFMLPWSFSEEAAAEKYMPQLQHNMRVVAARTPVLSVITGGGKWVEIVAHADPLYQHLIVTAERRSGVVSRAANSPSCLACNHPSRGLRPCGLSTWLHRMLGPSSPRFSRKLTRHISNMNRPRLNLRA
jgi:predicted phage-related endonuclease